MGSPLLDRAPAEALPRRVVLGLAKDPDAIVDDGRTVDVSDLTLDEGANGTVDDPTGEVSEMVGKVVDAQAKADEGAIVEALAGLFDPGEVAVDAAGPAFVPPPPAPRLSVVPDAPPEDPGDPPAQVRPPPPPPPSVISADIELDGPTAQEPNVPAPFGDEFRSLVPTISGRSPTVDEAPAPAGLEYIAMQWLGTSGDSELHIAYGVGPDAPSDPRVMRRLLVLDGENWEIRRARFLAEGRVGLAIRHDHMVRVQDVGEDADGPFIIRELVAGASLREIGDRARGELPVDAIIAIGLQVARALGHGHTATSVDGTPFHLVHGELSPSTILVDNHGNAKITEMGVARAGAEALCSTNGGREGRDGYAAPEQRRGTPITAAADLFSLGVVLGELLAGQPLLRGGAHRLNQLARTVRTACDARGDVPAGLSRLVVRMLEVDPARRPADAEEVASALEELLLRGSGWPDVAAAVAPYLSAAPPAARHFPSSLPAREASVVVASPPEAVSPQAVAPKEASGAEIEPARGVKRLSPGWGRFGEALLFLVIAMQLFLIARLI